MSKPSSKTIKAANKPPFKMPASALETRFRKLQQQLNVELGFKDARLSFKRTVDRSSRNHWQLGNASLSQLETQRMGSIAARLATAQSEAAQLYFAFAEEWIFEKGEYYFRSSNLRFVVTDTDPDSTPLQFRLEWAGRDPTADFTFNGQGAAHPHWNFDVDGSWVGPLPEPSTAEPETIVIDLETQVETIDLEALADPRLEIEVERQLPSDALAWFHKLHLPARAIWHELLRDVQGDAVGQQHDPSSPEEVDSWVLSALRYLKFEFELYAG